MSATRLLLQRLLYSGLDALRTAVPIELAACLHSVGAEEPQLYVRAPELAELDHGQTMEIRAALVQIADRPELQDAGLEVGGFAARALITGDARATTVWIFGRVEDTFDPAEMDLIDTVADAIGTVAATLAEADFPDRWDGIIRLSIDAADELPRAEVAVAAGKRVETGEAQGPSAAEAVANAVVAAVNPVLRMAGITEVTIDGADAVVVLLRAPVGRGAVGTALAGSNRLHAVGQATLDAVRALG